jgi:hypothetical protein
MRSRLKRLERAAEQHYLIIPQGLLSRPASS